MLATKQLNGASIRTASGIFWAWLGVVLVVVRHPSKRSPEGFKMALVLCFIPYLNKHNNCIASGVR